uniref:Uncharacterized protein n=2 Tax=Salix viminalis TaxID=40686 RepID=A0A6N2K3S4_SALVM
MHEDNQFGRCGRTLLWISDHILHGTLLSLPSPSSGYRRRRRRNREEGISNNRFYYGAAHDVHIDLLCASASSIGIPSPIFTKKLKETSETEEREEETDVEIETTPETKGTKQEQEGSTEEDPSSSLFSEEKENPDKIDETEEIRFVNFFGNDTKKDVSVHNRKTLL